MTAHSSLVFLHGGAIPCYRARVGKFYRDYCALQFMTRGAIELFYGQVRHELRCDGDGDEDTCWFWTAFPGPLIRFNAAQGRHEWNHRWVSFTGPLLEHWKHTGLWLNGPQRAPRGPQHITTFDEMIFHVERGGSWAMRRAGNLLEGIFLELAEARACNSADAWLLQAQRFVAQCSDFTPNYNALAQELGMSLPTLRRKFRAATGVSLHEALMQRRLTDARRLLAETDLPIKAVACELGYRDVYFFSKQFKERTLVTPVAFRHSQQI